MMTNTMTPSEIAEWLDGEAACKRSGHLRYSHAAATIRELEAKLDDKWERLIDALRRVEQSEAKLKIATEALEDFAKMDDPYVSQYASAALARIKEVV